MNIGQESIRRERARQIGVEGFTLSHDDAHDKNELYLAAECYACAAEVGRLITGKECPSEVIPCSSYWPWDRKWWKPGTTPRRNYEKAGALYMAEAERMQRLKDPSKLGDINQCRRHAEECACKINLGLSLFVRAFNQQTEEAYQNSVAKGFHDVDMGNGTRIALIHSEASEALDAIRHGNPPDDHIPDFTGAEAELADVVIRCMDMAEKNHWRLAEAVEQKMNYNATRPHMHGGKAF